MMGLILLTERHAKQIVGVLSCYDRVIVQGTLPVFCYAEGMTAYLTKRRIRIFDFTEFAKPLTDTIKANAEQLAAAHGLRIDYVRKKNFRKEDKVKAVLKERGDHPGLVWVFSALEPCTTYRPWHDKNSGRTYLRYDDGKCLHYYFYFIDEELGLARQLERKKIRYTLLDNAFTALEDCAAGQALADSWDPSFLHRKLDEFAQRYCPILKQIEETYHWSLDEAEYATDIMFHRQADLQAIYGNLIRTAIHTVKPDDIATFLGKKLHGNYQDEMGNRYNVRIEGTRVRHSMGMASIKMYDKFGQILRIETTAKDISFFKHYREVEQRNGEAVMKFAPMKKTIYSLGALRELLSAANRRYLEFLSAIDDPSNGIDKLNKITRTIHEEARSYRGFNFFDQDDEALFLALMRGEFTISGVQNKALRARFPQYSSAQMSRILRRLRTHGLIKKASHCYKYYLTVLGKQVVALGLKLKELVIIPQLAAAPSR